MYLSCVPAPPVAVLAIDEKIVCDASYTSTSADVTEGSVSDIATATSDETGAVECNTVLLPLP